ncbi:hypothetical protein ABT294_36575 [Nonomuraea sp. NPDC000554]|uniref:hypothetical protein n=1 Tax=Nonomuraea sp. NPDC000554 TaxID=3154259 RepID=UPI0033334D25
MYTQEASETGRPGAGKASVAGGDVPLVDPERRLGDASALAPEVRRAWRQVRERVVAESLMQVAQPGEERRPFPVLPMLAALHPEAEPELRRRVTGVVGCLEQLVRQYPADAELQEFLAVPPLLHRWIMEEPGGRELTIDYCRLDLLGSDLGDVRVLEFNPSSPGGVISSGMLTRFWRESSLGPVLADWAAPPAPFERHDWFARWLLEYGRERGVPDNGHPIGLYHASRSTRFELDQVQRQLSGCGREAMLMRPCEVGRADGVELGYFKFIPIELDEVPQWDRFCARLVEGTIVVPNRLGARWVAENKLCLAALSDPRFRRLFHGSDAAQLDTLVPYSRKLGDGIDEAEVIRRREELVLKAPYSFHGKDVHIGGEHDQRSWERVVSAPGHQGWLVQERLRAGALNAGDGTPYLHDLVVPVLGGRVIGYSSRANTGPLLNGAQGGGAYTLFSPHPLDDAAHSGGG